ncbi:MAG: hypothetical protein ACRDNB_04350 [Gaiellaceae bacterium]
MQHPLRIELHDPVAAESLRRALSRFHAETVRLDGHAEVRLELVAGNPEQRIVEALNLIDAWLATSGTASVRIHLDGHAYTLNAPPDAH